MNSMNLKIGDVFFTYEGAFMYEHEVIGLTAKAVNTSVTSFVAYPGVSDTVGTPRGKKWIPKKALVEDKKETLINVFRVAKWFKK